jgi:integrase
MGFQILDDVLLLLGDHHQVCDRHRLRATIGQVFRFAIATARAVNDPTIALRGALLPPKVKHRSAILDPIELGGFLRAVDGFTGQPQTRAALQLLPLVFTRPGELTRAEWIEFDLDKAVWAIPASNDKMRRGFDVPLAQQAILILRELHTSECLDPSPRLWSRRGRSPRFQINGINAFE